MATAATRVSQTAGDFLRPIPTSTVSEGDSDGDGSPKGNETSGGAAAERSCAVCGKPCTTRCSRCRSVYYCSVDCQRTDWNEKGHRGACRGKNKNASTKTTKTKTKTKLPTNRRSKPAVNSGPNPPVPSTVRNEADAERVLEEFWSIVGSAVSGDEPPAANSDANAEKANPNATKAKEESRVANDTKPLSSNKNENQRPRLSAKKSGPSSSSSSSSSSSALPPSLPPLPPLPTISDETTSFVAEEMAQISSFQLTLRLSLSGTHSKHSKNPDDQTSLPAQGSIAVATKPLGRSGSRTLVIIRRKRHVGTEDGGGRSIPETALFAGEFPRAIEASQISWRVVSSSARTDAKVNANPTTDVVFRLPYPYDPSATPGPLGSSVTGEVSSSTLPEINSVLCGSCHVPLLGGGGLGTSNTTADVDRGDEHSSSSTSSSARAIRRVFPLPLGHWDEIADYLICYDGQPVVNFSAGSECAEPSMALQDATLLCFHRRDVEPAVCVLAVNSYGECTERNANNATNDAVSDRNGDGNGNRNGNPTLNNDLGSFATKSLARFSSELPEPQLVRKEASPPSTTVGEDEEKDEARDRGGETIAPTSAVVRGDRSWRDATDGESVGLFCARCCAPLGFASLGSPETWRFWKHRLSVPHTAPNPPSNEAFVFGASLLQRTKPLGSSSSFLARELVRYAESKAIFTFVVRCEDDSESDSESCSDDGIATAKAARTTESMKRTGTTRTTGAFCCGRGRRQQHRFGSIRFRRVAKIVFEETNDPTVNNNQAGDRSNTHSVSSSATTQWFWGGVDLCCPPPSSSTDGSTTLTRDPTAKKEEQQQSQVSTVRLQLPREEYDTVLVDLVAGRSCFSKEVADATILLKMGDLWDGLGLTAVALE
eukprot:jgi/Psemu1/202906/e_gw1.309.6.1